MKPNFFFNKPYYPISQRYQEIFAERVYKISVSIADTCPNRREGGDQKVCIFCDEWGSAAYHKQADQSLDQQILIHREAIRKRYKVNQFLVYFQAYTNTFGQQQRFLSMYQQALQYDDVVGLVIGTRPDCLPKRMLKALDQLSQKKYVSVELGLQTLNDQQLIFLSRHHDRHCSLEAIEKLKALSNVDISVHLMFGIPEETEEQLIETAQLLSELGVHSVKLHNLHVLANTPLATLYSQGNFVPIELEEYSQKVALFLQHLSPKIAVHRLVAVASRWNELIAPVWTKEKMRPTQFIEDYMNSHQMWQGQKFHV